MIIGVDIGGTNIRAGLVKDNKILKYISIPTQAKDGKNIVINNILYIISKLFNKEVNAIGIGCPGPLNKKGVIIKTPNLPFKNFDLRKLVEKKFKVPVFIENDANCFTLGEAIIGKGKNFNYVVGLTLGTGVGGGIVINKKIYRGKSFAGELGHIVINFNGPKCSCGNNGCLEAYVSSYGVMRYAMVKTKTPKKLYEEALKGNKKAVDTFKEMGFYLGIGIINIVNILNPEIVVIGGQLSNAWKFFKDSMFRVTKNALTKVKIVKARFDHAIYGAAMLPNTYFLKP